MILTSAQHGGSSWTYVTSDTARIHQITPVGGDTIAILAAHQPPDAQIIDVFEAQWILALHHVDHRALTLTLDTRRSSSRHLCSDRPRRTLVIRR